MLFKKGISILSHVRRSKLFKERRFFMDRSEISFSSLSNNQIEEVKALETKLNSSLTSGQETILIAYTKPE